MKKRKSIVIVLLVLAIGLFAAWNTFRPQGQEGDKTITVNVNHLTGKDTTYTFSTDETYLRAALDDQNLIDGTEQEYGLWVTTVDGETADDSKQEWWGYHVNGEMAVYGVDEQTIADGDVFDFTLNVGW